MYGFVICSIHAGVVDHHRPKKGRSAKGRVTRQITKLGMLGDFTIYKEES